ncbi:MAG: 2-amino-4-hydroxy-6-hydroxymethyldihydropteridine diphosphokinase [Syntrophorhabdaceae bacterium]|nr:2-amino-4-hydroxy-6-hydroxymethyldihydropteridine diphosphokinase [Syntrophorhabdaceae bacterium]
MDKKIFIGIGSNIGQGYENCKTAIRRISSDHRADLRSISSFYSTSPVSDIRQDDYINCAVEIDWHGTPLDLLRFLADVESSMGRVREEKNGPRVIDLDILMYGDGVIDEEHLTVPHKELHRRKFAIVPCIEIDPDLVHPSLKKPLSLFLSDIPPDQQVVRLEGIAFKEE